MVVTTPSKYKVFLKDYLSFGQKRELQKLIFSKLKIKPSADSEGVRRTEIEEFSVDFMQDIQDKAFNMLIEKIEIEGKEYTDNLFELVMSWNEKDGQSVFTEIDKITAIFGASELTEVTADSKKKTRAV